MQDVALRQAVGILQNRSVGAASPASASTVPLRRKPWRCRVSASRAGAAYSALAPERRARLSSLPLALRGRGAARSVKVSGTL